jgi:two-component system, NarL family, invasion response regulator UvrY
MTNVLIVDDHPIVRRGLKDILKEEKGFAVTEAENAQGALSLIERQAFDLVVLDLDLPGMNGLELLNTIRRQHKQLRVLVLSIYPEDQFAIRVLKAGASGFISKDAVPEQLVSTIRKILRGAKHVSERTANLLVQRLHDHRGTHLHEKLSDREFQVLCLVGEGKTIKQIAEALSLSAPTISTYRARILDKMDMSTTAELVRYAIQNGLAKPK